MRCKVFRFSLRFFCFLLLYAAIAACLIVSAVFCLPAIPTVQSTSSSEKIGVVVLDAGHGGEDGGAVSASGIMEKDLNLRIAFLLRDLLEANGIEVVMTRETDTMLYPKDGDYQGRKKALDLAERKRIAEETPNSVLISIHINTYPLPDCQGLQVWYSANDTRSERLAETIQSVTQQVLQPDNSRKIKQAGSNIYLLHHSSVPAVLVECGFLSSPTEAKLLESEDYQKQLALTVFLGIMQSDFLRSER